LASSQIFVFVVWCRFVRIRGERCFRGYIVVDRYIHIATHFKSSHFTPLLTSRHLTSPHKSFDTSICSFANSLHPLIRFSKAHYLPNIHRSWHLHSSHLSHRQQIPSYLPNTFPQISSPSSSSLAPKICIPHPHQTS